MVGGSEMDGNSLTSIAKENPSEFVLLAVSLSLKNTWGPTANVALYSSGKELGKSLNLDIRNVGSLEEAFSEIEKALNNAWKGRLDGDKLIFEECVLRELYRRGGIQSSEPLPTCYFHMGFCAGMLEKILGKKVNLKVLSKGPLSCVEQIIIEE